LSVRVISRKRLRQASEKHSEWEASLNTWYKVARHARWKHFAEVQQSWSNSDPVGTCVVFDIANNRCRLITYIAYRTQKVFILYVLTHADYDKGWWKNACGC
jgi:mRNA interferase HigB